MPLLKRLFLASLFALSVVPLPLLAQGEKSIPMAEALRSSGKIWVVVASLVLILAGLFLYLVRTERKLKKLEEQTDTHSTQDSNSSNP